MQDQMSNTDKVREHQTPVENEYWSKFYSKKGFSNSSSFAQFINEQSDTPAAVLDIGCGDGRDSFAFATTGKTVIGIDRSEVGVEHANQKSKEADMTKMLSFSVCDISDESHLSKVIKELREQSGGKSVCFYMRFFLHSIPEDTQEILLQTLAKNALPGDTFAAEFRTDKDEEAQHVFGDTHYRRYQNADDFSKKLVANYGWSITYEVEESGLSPYKGEDPVLYRVVAIRK